MNILLGLRSTFFVIFPLFKWELFSVDQTNIGQKLDLLICSPRQTFKF